MKNPSNYITKIDSLDLAVIFLDAKAFILTLKCWHLHLCTAIASDIDHLSNLCTWSISDVFMFAAVLVVLCLLQF